MNSCTTLNTTALPFGSNRNEVENVRQISPHSCGWMFNILRLLYKTFQLPTGIEFFAFRQVVNGHTKTIRK